MAKGNKFSEDNTEGPVETTAIENQTENAGAEASGEAKEIKSIVPSKYAAKYKDPSNDDPLRKFIKEQCGTPIDLVKFYALLRANSVGNEHIEKFEAVTTNLPEGQKPAGGVAGRAVMTLRNRLTPIARSDKGLVGLDGKTYDVKLPPAPKTGAVAKAAEAKAAASEQNAA